MTIVKLNGKQVHTIGQLPEIGSKAPPFTLTGLDLEEFSLKDFAGSLCVLNIFPSLDTPVCACSVSVFDQLAQQFEGVKIISVSADLPFAQRQFVSSENILNSIAGSTFRHPEFGEHYGVVITDGPLRGLMSRAVIVIDEKGNILHTEQVKELSDEPDYNKIIKIIEKNNNK